MSNFRVGQKIVCVDDNKNKNPPPFGFRWTGKISISKGNVYTIKSIGVHPVIGSTCVELIEVMKRSDTDYGYNVCRFRPLISQSDDIAMFKALLAPTPELVPTSD